MSAGPELPDLSDAPDTLTAVLRWIACGCAVVPVAAGSKSPGSIKGSGWPSLSTRDPQVAAAEWAGRDHGIALHLGRSGEHGFVVFDVDRPELVDPEVMAALAGLPFQSTDGTDPRRGHYFAQAPAGRRIGNGVGRLGPGLDVRGHNGVVIAAPSLHARAADGGRYAVVRPGPIPPIPAELLARLPAAQASPDDVATAAEVVAFVAEHTAADRPRALQGPLTKLDRELAAGASRHNTTVGCLTWALKEARAGRCSAAEVLDALRDRFADAMAAPRTPADRRPTPAEVASEWAGIVAWSGAAAAGSDPVEGRRSAARARLTRHALPRRDQATAEQGADERPAAPDHGRRTITLTAASSIKVRPVLWLWALRMALGTLVLLGGREGIGKSTLAYTLAADITCGRLPGAYAGQPRAVIVAATEDSWAHTIVPRLIGAGADLARVYRVDVITAEDVETGLSLPRDVHALEDAVREVGAALILLDPLMSRLDAKLDSHKDAEVRLALEPLVKIADRTGATVLGLIHVNKSQSTDPLSLLMGSRAFAAVARAVLFVMLDPDDETTRLLGQPKNNLGSTELPTLAFRIESVHVQDTDDGPVTTGHVVWQEERETSIREVLEAAGGTADDRSATSEAGDWLADHLTSCGGSDDSASIKAAGGKAGHSQDALKRARRRLGAAVESAGFPRRTYWTLSGTALQSARLSGSTSSGSKPGESAPTALTAPTAPIGSSVGAVSAVGAVGAVPARDAPTALFTVDAVAEPVRGTWAGLVAELDRARTAA